MPEVQTSGLDSDGVFLISPLRPEFDSLLDDLSPQGMADVVKEAKPYVVIVANKTRRRIVALTTSSSNFEGTAMPNPLFSSHPASAVENQLFTAPDAVGATGLDFGERSERGIPSGSQRIMGLGFSVPAVRPKFEPQPEAPEWDDERMWAWVVSTTRDFVKTIKTQGAGTKGITIRLDAVIFEDGLLIGPDTHDILRSNLEGHVHARQELYRKLISHLDRSESVEELVAIPRMSLSDFPDAFKMEAIGSARELRKRYGDKEFRRVLQQAILKQPFVTHRE